MAALTSVICGRQLGDEGESQEGENKRLQQPVRLRSCPASFVLTKLDSRAKACDNASFSF